MLLGGPRRGREHDVAARPVAGLAREFFGDFAWALALAGQAGVRDRRIEAWAAAPARGRSDVLAAGCDTVGPGRGGALCRGWWPGSVARHASAASGGRRLDRRGCSNAPGAVVAGTSVHSP